MNTLKNIIMDNLTQMELVSKLSIENLLLVMGTTLLAGLLIYFTYKYFYRGGVYSENFGLLLVFVAMTIAFIIVTISSNLVLSLGMVGALSVVRFRTAIKDPLDVGFLFLSIAAGLTAGAGLFFIAIVGTAIVCMVFVVMNYLGKRVKTYLLIVQCDEKSVEGVKEVLRKTKASIKTINSSQERVELTYSVRISDESFISEVRDVEGVENVVLVAYTGDGQY